MALATVNIDKIVKVTSASSYVYSTHIFVPPILEGYQIMWADPQQ